MSKRQVLNTIKRRLGRQLAGEAKITKTSSWEDSFWAKQLRVIETFGQGLVIMRMG